MTNALPSIGDVKKSLKRVQEKVDLPESRTNIISRVRDILEMGGVQKITIEIGQPIKVERLVKSDGLDGAEPTDDDLMNAARNGEIHELTDIGNVPPFEELFYAFDMFDYMGIKATALMVNTVTEFSTWLGLQSQQRRMYGVEIIAHPGIPEGTALLVCNDIENNPEIRKTFSVRISMGPVKEKKNEANSGEGPKKRNRGSGNGRVVGKVGQPA